MELVNKLVLVLVKATQDIVMDPLMFNVVSLVAPPHVQLLMEVELVSQLLLALELPTLDTVQVHQIYNVAYLGDQKSVVPQSFHELSLG